MKRITTTDIAQLSGVSRTTVSAVLNGKPSVRKQTREKVLACIREHHFVPGLIAKSLLSEISNMVVVLAPNLSNPFYGSVYEAVDKFLQPHGFHVLLYKVRHEDEGDPSILKIVKAYRPTGYIVPGGGEGQAARTLLTLIGRENPVVAIDTVFGVETSAIVFNNRRASTCITDYVLDKGHRHVAYLAGPRRSQGAKERHVGFLESVVEHELPSGTAMVVESGETPEEGYKAARQVLSRAGNRLTALVCFNDMVAVGVYRAAHELGLHIPGDISVTGFDGIEVGEVLGPPLTTLSIQPARLGQAAAQLLLEIIREETRHSPVVRELDFTLVERDSVKAISEVVDGP